MIYPTSTDYSLLYVLVQQGNRIICLIDGRLAIASKGIDVFVMIDYKEVVLSDYETGQIGCKETFVQSCGNKNLQWIVPTTAYIGEKYTIQIIPRFTKRDYQWIAVVSWKEEVVYYAMFQFDKIETYAYTQPLANLLVNHLDYCTTIEEALKQGLEIVKQLQANEN